MRLGFNRRKSWPRIIGEAILDGLVWFFTLQWLGDLFD